MFHKIFGYRGFIVRIIPREILARNSSTRAKRCYAASVVIMRFTGMPRRKHATHFYPAGVCRTAADALELGARYATVVIDEDLIAGTPAPEPASQKHAPALPRYTRHLQPTRYTV